MVHFVCISPPKFNKSDFVIEISNTISKSLNNYDNIVQADDLIIDLSHPSKGTQIICLIRYLILT